MKKPITIALGVILLTALGVQTYRVYRLHQQVSRLQASNPFAMNFKEDLPPKMQPDDDFAPGTWNPYQEMQRMHNEIEQALDNSFSRFQINSGAGSFTKTPALDLKEEKDRYVVTLDLPGADASSLDVKLDGQQLFIFVKTERSSEQNGGDKNQYHRRERFVGTFERSLTLPGPVKESAMKTDYSDGVLTITIPKA